MKLVILAGGFGTRISEESIIKPKPMIELGGKPILWHIMKHHSAYGIEDFIILLGYKGYMIKEFFANYYLHNSDVMIDTAKSQLSVLSNLSENWKITLVDTGLHTMTGGRVKRARKYIGDDDFLLTYGDGLSDVNIQELITFHQKHNRICTLTTVQPEGRFGALDLASDGTVQKFLEKPKGDGSWINGGFMVCKKELFDFIKEGDETILERAPLENLAKAGQLIARRHHGFWKPMDTLRDKQQLEALWQSGEAPWKTWI